MQIVALLFSSALFTYSGIKLVSFSRSVPGYRTTLSFFHFLKFSICSTLMPIILHHAIYWHILVYRLAFSSRNVFFASSSNVPQEHKQKSNRNDKLNIWYFFILSLLSHHFYHIIDMYLYLGKRNNPLI